MPPFTATQNQLLTEHLRNFLPGIEPEALELLRAQLEWVEVPGGSTLMAQGEPGESMYLTVSGRLRAYVRSDDGHSGTQRRVADMGRGQVIGEISLFTDAPRAATVVAVRDSVLVRLTKDVFKTLLASISIPGALPPVVHEGDLLCDGGTFNNFPVDVMRSSMRGVGTVIGVDLNFRKPRRIELDDIPSSWALLRDKLRPRAQRRYKLPSLASYLMQVTILYSMSRQRQSQQLTDLYFNPPMDRVGMLQWNRFEQIVQQGYAHGIQVLDALDDTQRRRIGGLRTSSPRRSRRGQAARRPRCSMGALEEENPCTPTPRPCNASTPRLHNWTTPPWPPAMPPTPRLTTKPFP